jgi:hypothetical protein
MNSDSAGVQLFNLETMSGVYPGTRTQVYQRVRLLPMGDDGRAPCWAQILWYDDPPSCVLQTQTQPAEGKDAVPLLRLLAPHADDLNQRLQEALRLAGWQMQSCGACSHWQPERAGNSDGVPLGVCGLHHQDVDIDNPPALLATQSMLALACCAWQPATGLIDQAMPPIMPMQPLPKVAETSDSKKRGLARLAMEMRKRFAPQAQPKTLAERLTERSGVGAGTESCFACQGRIANLAALAVESEQGDKQTFSVWRCRICYTLYLSNWIDRWERLESLETEETIYRIAPIEAMELLTVIDNVAGGEHPGKRAERSAQRDWIEAQAVGWNPLSHIIKQGR